MVSMAVMAPMSSGTSADIRRRRPGSTYDGGLPSTLARVHLRRLLPEPGELTPEEATTGLRLGELAPPDRPYLVVNMVSTLDGRIAIGGRSGPIGGEADREPFPGLPTQADAGVGGARPIRTERHGPGGRRPQRRAPGGAGGAAAGPPAP